VEAGASGLRVGKGNHVISVVSIAARRPGKPRDAVAGPPSPRSSFRSYLGLLCGAALLWTTPVAASNVVFTSNYVRPVISGGVVALLAAGIKNNSSRATGTLRMELWAASQPFAGSPVNPPPMDFKLAQFQLGVLQAGQEYVNVGSPWLPLGTPPDGIWYYVIFLTEFTGGTVNGGFTVADWVTAPDTVTIGPPPPPPPTAPATALAVEYFNAAWGFYFMTAFATEINALDGGAFGGAWQRTGESFTVWPQPTLGSAATCRFFSDVFAPRSTHVYTPFVSECDALKASSAWSYEGIAFYLQLVDANGFCAAGTMALYRLYNNGMGGAPNHRYTTSLSILNDMVAAGWAFEGNGNTKVFACVPQ